MLAFRKLDDKDAPLIRSFSPYYTSRLCDFTPVGLLMWRDFFHTEMCHEADHLFFRQTFYHHVNPFFCIPQGPDPIGQVKQILEFCESTGDPARFCNVSKEELALLEAQYSVECSSAHRDYYDYLYVASDLAQMQGRKFAGQRNHIHRFEKEYPGYEYREITGEMDRDIMAFLDQFLSQHEESDMIEEESSKIHDLLANWESNALLGGTLWHEGKLLAFAIGDIVRDTLFVHIEKALPGVNGAYQTIVREFASHNLREEVQFINREDDLGVEGLRTSKLSYHPVELLEKHNVVLRLEKR